MAAARFACSPSALSNAACALSTACCRRSRSFCLAVSSLARSSSRRFCSRSKARAAFRSAALSTGRAAFSFPCGLPTFGRLRWSGAAQIGGQFGVLGEGSVGADGSPENDARLCHGRRDGGGILALLRRALMEEIAVGAPRFQSRLHRRGRDRLVEEAQRSLVGLQFSRHETLPRTPAARDLMPVLIKQKTSAIAKIDELRRRCSSTRFRSNLTPKRRRCIIVAGSKRTWTSRLSGQGNCDES